MSLPVTPEMSLVSVEEESSHPTPEASTPRFVTVVPQLAISLAEAHSRVAHLKKFVLEMMVPGEDYGLIPGCNKPTLLKPGAEKLCDIFGFAKHVAILDQVENWDKGIFAYTIKATLISKHSGTTEAEGLGSCNSKERRYRNQDAFSLANTILKMAKKRALVDAVLSATRSSGLFTQDMEDIGYTTVPKRPTGEPGRSTTTPVLNQVFALVRELGISRDDAKALLSERYGISSSSELTDEQTADLLAQLLTRKSEINEQGA